MKGENQVLQVSLGPPHLCCSQKTAGNTRKRTDRQTHAGTRACTPHTHAHMQSCTHTCPCTYSNVIKFNRQSLGWYYRKGKKKRKEEGDEEIRFSCRSLLNSRLGKVWGEGDLPVLCPASQGLDKSAVEVWDGVALQALPHLPSLMPHLHPR